MYTQNPMRSADRKWDWLAAVLFFAMTQVAAARLVMTEWTPYLYWTETLAAAGTILGLALGVSRLGKWRSLFLALGYSLMILPWQASMSFKEDHLLDRLGHLAATLGASYQQFAQREVVKEPLLFLLFVCLVFWLIGLAGGYWLARGGRALGGVILVGTTIIIIQSYANYQPLGSWWIAIFALLALLLVGRVHFLRHRPDWARRRIFVGEDSGTNLMSGLFWTVALTLAAAWWIPVSPGSVQRAADTWNQYVKPFEERFSKAVDSLTGPYGKPGGSFYGGALPLGHVAASGDQIVLTVEVLQSPGINLRYYWRGFAYNDYSAGTWSSDPPTRLLFHADDQEIGIPYPVERSEGIFRVTSLFDVQSLIYGPAPAVWVDRTANVAAERAASGSYDVLSWESRLPVSKGSSYELRSRLRNPTVLELRQAGESYPAWVTAKYLGMPENDRGRLTALAEELTVGTDGVYDKASVITTYLRRNIAYSPNIPTPPEGTDPVLWVLFDYKQGYCNYYASAEVLLLRSIGIPARLAVGFARGEFVDGHYTVHRRDAHAWPEVYFPGIGWVEFEPTANQDALVRPSGEQFQADATSGIPGGNGQLQDPNRIPEQVELAPAANPLPFRLTPAGRVLFSAGPIVLALAALALAYRARIWTRLPGIVSRSIEAGGGGVPGWLRSWERWQQLQPVERAFASVSLTLRFLGQPQPVDATPTAQAAALSRRVPSAARYVNALHDELERGLFANATMNPARARWASLMLVLHGLRAKAQEILAGSADAAVYSAFDSRGSSRRRR